MLNKILIIDDDVELLISIEEMVGVCGYSFDSCTSAEEAIKMTNLNDYLLILSDIQMPGEDGIWLANNLDNVRTPVILMTAYGTIDRAVEALKIGVKDFITKPFTKNKLISAIEEHKNSFVESDYALEDESTKEIAREIQLVSKHEGAPILLTGESGVGKDVFANMYHTMSSREGKFVSVNCGAIPENMLESILFGHEKGSFTGASKRHDGKFIQANNGTLFLDEIGEMSMDLQVKLLRVLETRMVERVGSSEETKVDINLVTATNANLSILIESGKFREDLYYRINVVEIKIRPLRERPKDLKKLISLFIDKYSKKYSKKLTISSDVMLKLETYSWPGNIRELKNIINRASIKSESIIDKVDIDISVDEKTSINNTLIKFKGNRKDTAEHLGVSIRTLQYKIKKYDLYEK